jgi:glycosyltransferase involved in cell wall biosynthesis
MRVAHLACVAPPEIGGIGRVAAEEVKELRVQGIEAMLFAPRGPSLLPEEVGICRLQPYWRLGNASMLPKDPILSWKPDVIHLHYPFYGTAETWLWRKRSIPIVVTFHMDATPAGWRGGVATLHQRLFQSWFLGHAAACIVSSRDYAEHSSLAPILTALGSRIEEVPFSVHTDQFAPQSHPASTQVQFLFVGGMDKAHHFKGVSELLQALADLKTESWRLTLIGEGELRAIYEARAHELGLTERVTFRGRVPDGDLVRAYQAADVLLFPSTTMAEAFGLVALEAQACGVPVIASDLPGVRTVVRHEETGLLVPPGSVPLLREAIKRLLHDPILRQRLGEAARSRTVATYSWPVHVQALKRIYERVCELPS